MRLRIQIGGSEVDVGKEIQRGINELDRIRRQQAKKLRRLRATYAPAERKIISGLSSVTALLGYRLVPVEGNTTTAAPVPSSATLRTARSAKRSAYQKPKAKRR